MSKDKGRPGRVVSTLSDVAREAGVTVGTASKALNGQGKLREETRQRVHEAAQRLGFRPNDLLRSVIRGRSYTVGLLSTDSLGRFSIPIVTGAESTLGQSQISVFLCNTLGDPERERHYLDSLLSKQVDGIIVVAAGTNVRPPIDLGHAKIPTVYAFTRVTTPDALSVMPDDMEGGRLAIAHLIGLGRRRFAHITGPAISEVVQKRALAMQQTLDSAGLHFRAEQVLFGPWRERWGYEAINIALERDPTIDAIFCGNDVLARGAMDGLRECGIAIPTDVAVVGFDNWEIIAEAARPMLTSIDMNLFALGSFVGTRLIEMIEGESESGLIQLPCSLVVRQSCGASATPMAATPPTSGVLTE